MRYCFVTCWCAHIVRRKRQNAGRAIVCVSVKLSAVDAEGVKDSKVVDVGSFDCFSLFFFYLYMPANPSMSDQGVGDLACLLLLVLC